MVSSSRSSVKWVNALAFQLCVEPRVDVGESTTKKTMWLSSFATARNCRPYDVCVPIVLITSGKAGAHANDRIRVLSLSCSLTLEVM